MLPSLPPSKLDDDRPENVRSPIEESDVIDDACASNTSGRSGYMDE